MSSLTFLYCLACLMLGLIIGLSLFIFIDYCDEVKTQNLVDCRDALDACLRLVE